MSVIAGIIALCSLVLSLVTFWDRNRFERLSVKPLPVILQGETDREISVIFSNKGVGPLIIKSCRMRWGGAVKELGRSTLQALLYDGHSLIQKGEFDLLYKGRVLSAGERVELFKITSKTDNEFRTQGFDPVRARFRELVIELDYEDTFGSSFETFKQSFEWLADAGR